MARPARVEYEGAFYHVMNRGNGSEKIFIDKKDRHKFYEILGSVEKKHGIVIYAFVLMSNHYHILLETQFANLSRAVQQLNGDFALYFTRRHKKPGHLFQGRFKAMLVEKEAYLLELSRYIHLNPFRAGMVKRPEKYKWSSLSAFFKGEIKLPFTLHGEWILSTFGKKRGIAVRRYVEFVREGMKNQENPGLEASGGWILGREKWVEKIIEKWVDFSSKELTGVKPLKVRIPVDKMERVVCGEFKVTEDDLSKNTYNNLARSAIIYLTVNCCGLKLKEAGERYGGINDSAVNKSITRFRNLLAKNNNLNLKLKKIISIVEM